MNFNHINLVDIIIWNSRGRRPNRVTKWHKFDVLLKVPSDVLNVGEKYVIVDDILARGP